VAVHARDLDSTQILQAPAAAVDVDATDVDELVCRPRQAWAAGHPGGRGPRRIHPPKAGRRRTAPGWAVTPPSLGVRLLVGTRPGPQTKLLQALGASAARNGIDLDDTTYIDKADLAEYVRRRLLLEGVPPDRLAAHDTPYRGPRPPRGNGGRRGWLTCAYPSFLIAALTAVGLVRSGNRRQRRT